MIHSVEALVTGSICRQTRGENCKGAALKNQAIKAAAKLIRRKIQYVRAAIMLLAEQ